MTTVFIGGSRRTPRIPKDVLTRIDRMVSQKFKIVVGDANGADKAVQKYLHDCGYRTVEVFCSGRMCRNNVSDWPLRSVEPPKGAKGFAFYTAKDRVMAEEADYGLMVWDGESVGTLVNVLRMATAEKPVVLFIVPERRFQDIRGEAGWCAFADALPLELRARVEDEARPPQVLPETKMGLVSLFTPRRDAVAK
jgi:hypothetical protein